MKTTWFANLTCACLALIASPVRAQECGCGQTYRIVHKTVYDQEQVTAYRWTYETVLDERQVTVQRPVIGRDLFLIVNGLVNDAIRLPATAFLSPHR